jgi:hypothetical protein
MTCLFKLRIISFFLLSLISLPVPVFSQDRIAIVANPGDSVVQNLAEELKGWLEKAAGSQSFYIVGRQSRDPFIQLAVIQGMNDSLRKEGFSINGHGKQLVISAKHINGLSNGVYYYLNMLGFRFYLPGEIWTHIPKLKTVFLPVKKTVYPAFANRALFPTGGIRANLALDPNNLYQRDWEDWLQQNLYSSEERIDGHMGEQFNNKHKIELLTDTALLALVKGRRRWSASAKWCVSNPGFVRLFVQDRLEAFAQMKKRFPDRNLISVEPADGYGDCECANCQKMGTVSDRYFYLANQAAAAIARQWPGGGVSLFAYNTHAAVPGIQLLPNVYVTIIPYRFQNITEPSVLLAMWREKCTHIGVYDYWGITSDCMDLPLFNFLQQLPGKYKLWQELGLKGFLLETGYSKFNNALAFYCFSRMQWFGETDVQQILRQFCEDNFGQAAVVLNNMLSRWGTRYKLRIEVPVSLAELKIACTKEKDPLVQKRLDEIRHTVVYAALEDYTLNNINEPRAEKRVDTLLRYIWSVFDNRLINTGVIHNLIRMRLLRAHQDVSHQWDLKEAKSNFDYWQNMGQYKFTEPLPSGILNPLKLSFQPGIRYPVHDESLIDSVFRGQKTHPADQPVRLQASFQFGGSVLSDREGTIALTITFTESFKNPERLPVAVLYSLDGVFLRYIELKKAQTVQQVIFSDLIKNTRYKLVVYANANFVLTLPNRLLLVNGDATGTVQLKLLSSQQPALMLVGEYTHYIDPYRFIGEVRDIQGKTMITKTKKTVKREGIITCPGGNSSLRIFSKNNQPFSLEVMNGNTLFGFF